MSMRRLVPRGGLSILKPMPPPLFVAAALIVLVAGAAYCMGYEALLSGRANWPLSLLWSACAVLPWLALFELIKRREWRSGRKLPLASVALLLVGTAALSLLLEAASDLLLGRPGAPIALELLRRLPAAAATILLLLLARRAAAPANRGVPRRPPDSEAETLRRHAAAIRWIRAADNYLELHLEGRVWTRRLTMREAEAILTPHGFVRIHRSTIVNRAHVEAIIGNGDAAVRMDDGSLLPIGKSFADNLRRIFAPSPQSV